MPEQTTNVSKIKNDLDAFSDNCKRRYLRGHFLEILDELQNNLMCK